MHGHKVGLSSQAMQEMMGVDEPDYGHLLSDMECCRGRRRSTADRYCYPRVEVEVGVRPGRRPCRARTAPKQDVLAATEYVAPEHRADRHPHPGLEDRLADTIADNASSAGFILGAGAGGAAATSTC